MGRDTAKKIWLYTIIVITIGLIALYSATYQNVRVPHSLFYNQLVWAGVGLVFMYYVSRFDYRHYYDAAYVVYAINVIILLFVLIGGRHALGARRWIEIAGFNFQPSELTKFAVILLLARYYSNRNPNLSFNFHNKLQEFFRDVGFPFFLVCLSMALIFKQPDLGTSLLMLGIFLFIAFASDVDWRFLGVFCAGCVAIVPVGWHALKEYQKDRLLVFLNPNIDPLGAGYTIIQSQISVGSGQLWGKGWLSGSQNLLNFLPERHTDFIFSVIGEEWGLLGTVFLIYCYFILINCGLDIASHLKDKFGQCVAIGIVAILLLQVVINIGMVLGLCPVVGLTLPLISYGRTSFLMFIFMMGVLLNLNRKRMAF